MTFDQLGLAPELLRAVADEGYTEPTPVQREAIPYVLAGRDLLAGAQTGTGKTAAFVLPILQRLNASRGAGPAPSADRRNATRPPIRVLVLTPTRELALQVEQSVRTYGAHRPVRSTTIYGGVGFDPQVRALRAGPEIVVATPGRLLDHVSQRTIDLGSVEVLVLDEADRMLDMGFIRDIRKILALLPARRQNLLFSATFSDDIRRLADGLLDHLAEVQIARRNTAAELVRQLVLPVDRERKRDLLSHLIRSGRIDQALVFTRTKHGANRLAGQLVKDGIAAAAIHGNKSQSQRVRALDDFKGGPVAVLVATDIAARGLDIDALPHVVNYELPMVPEDYIHRIGRTGRAGTGGDAISLVCVDEAPLLRAIEGVLGRQVPTEIVPGFEPDPRIRPEPVRLRSGEMRQGMGRSSGQGNRGGANVTRPSGGRPNGARPAGRPNGPASGARPGGPRPGGARPGEPRVAAPGFGAARPAPRPGIGNRPSGPVPSQPGGHRPFGDRRDRGDRGFAPGRRPASGAGGRPTDARPRPAGPRPGGHGPGPGPAGGSAPRSMPGERIARQGGR
ncbi:MAG TPA: DEAD/DEAH box helicase [Candidatus Limnocylindrales bacterium]